MTILQRRYLYLAVFASGMCVLGVELSAARLLGNVFGTSNLVWANIIGLILIYLSLGYLIGGRWADRSPKLSTLYQIICWGAFLSGIVPLVARPVLFAAAQAVYDIDAGVAVGSFISILVLFALPITLLGCVSPFAIRLSLKSMQDSGQTIGFMYAVSTFGSILGTFVPTLYLIPELGTARTFLFFAFLLLGVGLGGLMMVTPRLALRLAWMPIVLIALAIFILSTPQRPVPSGYTLLYEKDSAYNYIQIVEDAAGYRYLWLNEGQGIHTQYHPTELYYRRTWDFFLAAPYFNAGYRPSDLERIAIIGLAGGTIARQHQAVYGDDLVMDGIEIDGDIVAASREYLGMTQPNLNVIVEDARYAFRRLDGPYSMVAIDAYRVPYVPWQLTTVEFFEEIRERLAPNGVVAINVGRTPSDRRLEQAMAQTMLQVYPTVHRWDVPNSLNTILIATNQPTHPDDIEENYANLSEDTHPLLLQVLNDARLAWQPTQTIDLIFTDDRAPVETLVNQMTFEFLFSGDFSLLSPQ